MTECSTDPTVSKETHAKTTSCGNLTVCLDNDVRNWVLSKGSNHNLTINSILSDAMYREQLEKNP